MVLNFKFFREVKKSNFFKNKKIILHNFLKKKKSNYFLKMFRK